MRSLLISLLVLLTAGLAFATGGGEGSGVEEPTTLTFWDMVWGPSDTYPQASDAIVQRFNAIDPSVTVELQMVDWMSWYEKFIAAIMGGSAPDVATASSSAPFMFSQMGELLDLAPVLDQWRADGTYDDMLQASYDAYALNGIQAAIPWQVDSRCFYYRTDVFEELGLNPNPADFAEFIDVLRVIRDQTDMIPLLIAGGDNMGKHFAYQLAIYNDVGMVNEQMEADFTNPGWAEVFEFVNALVSEGLVSPGTIGYKDADVDRLFFSGAGAIMLSSVSPEILSYPDVADKTGIMGVFTGPSSTTRRSSSFVNPVMAFAQTSAPDKALDFLAWWSENNITLFTEGLASSMPTRFSQLEDPYFSSTWVWEEAARKVLPYNVAGGVYPMTSEYPAYSALNGERVALKPIQEVLMADGEIDIAALQAETNELVEQAIEDSEK